MRKTLSEGRMGVCRLCWDAHAVSAIFSSVVNKHHVCLLTGSKFPTSVFCSAERRQSPSLATLPASSCRNQHNLNMVGEVEDRNRCNSDSSNKSQLHLGRNS